MAVKEAQGSGLYAEVHDGIGPYALLVHGILSSRAQWLPNLAALGEVCRPVVIELLGHGRSPAPSEPERYTPEGYVAAFERVREEVGADRWLVVGQSLGAALTIRYSLDHPDKVLAHVFTNSSSALADEAWTTRMRSGAPAMAGRVEKGGSAAIATLPVHPARARHMPDEIRRALVEDAGLLRPEALALTFLHTLPGSSVRSRVGENRVPALLVAGEREESFTEARSFAEQHMPRLEVVSLDAGHAVNIGASVGFNEAVVDFFARWRTYL